MRNFKLICIAAILLSQISCGFRVISTGHRGVKTNFGKVVSESLQEGIYFYNPITTTVHEMDVRIQKFEDETETYSLDAQIVKIKSTVNFNLKSDEAHLMLKEVGRDWDAKLLPQVVQASVKQLIGKYKAVDIISNRAKVTSEIFSTLKEKFINKRIVVTSFDINNLDFDDSFEEAVKNKVIAVETAKEAKNKTARISEEAKQKVIAAKAQAESMRIRAQALSQNKNLVEYEAVQKWNGKLPDYVGGAMPFIKLNK